MTINLSSLRPRFKTKKPLRRGRGIAQGQGKTAGRGTKGQKAKRTIPPHFEGGQMPLTQRLPKARGFHPINKIIYAVVNIDDLKKFEINASVSIDILKEQGLVSKNSKYLKVLGEGNISKPLTIIAQAFSKIAKEKIEKAGGVAQISKIS